MSERTEESFFPLGMSDSMNEESPGGARAAAQLSGSASASGSLASSSYTGELLAVNETCRRAAVWLCFLPGLQLLHKCTLWLCSQSLPALVIWTLTLAD